MMHSPLPSFLGAFFAGSILTSIAKYEPPDANQRMILIPAEVSTRGESGCLINSSFSAIPKLPSVPTPNILTAEIPDAIPTLDQFVRTYSEAHPVIVPAIAKNLVFINSSTSLALNQDLVNRVKELRETEYTWLKSWHGMDRLTSGLMNASNRSLELPHEDHSTENILEDMEYDPKWTCEQVLNSSRKVSELLEMSQNLTGTYHHAVSSMRELYHGVQYEAALHLAQAKLLEKASNTKDQPQEEMASDSKAEVRDEMNDMACGLDWMHSDLERDLGAIDRLF